MSGAPLQSKPHYAGATRRLLRLFDAGRLPNVTAVDVEPAYGYVTHITYVDGSTRVTFGNDLGLNAGSAQEVCDDKGHTKFLLRLMGVPCPDGREFLLPWWADELRPTLTKRGHDQILTIDQAHDYVVAELGYPVYVKAVAGSKGQGVRRVEDREALDAALAELERARSKVAVVEEAIDLPDYRIVTLDGQLVMAYRRHPLQVVGDGRSTVAELLAALKAQLDVVGRDTVLDRADPRSERHLAALGLTFTSVPDAGQAVVLADVSNLSAGGTSEDVGAVIHPRWVELAVDIARRFGLRMCGTDLACADITSPDAEASVIEVNSTPGMEHYAAGGPEHDAIVDALYVSVLDELPT